MSTPKWIVVSLLVTTVLIAGGNAYEVLQNQKLAKFCTGQGYPNTWRGLPNQRPAWATEKRLDALCAVTMWLREDLRIQDFDPDR